MYKFQYFILNFKKISLKNFLLLLSIICFLSACSSKKDPITGESEKFEPNAYERAAKYAKENPVLFGEKNSKNNTFDFATSNILWRASLKSLDFLPLISSDYSGGVLIYDWYSQSDNSKEQIKISVYFLSSELRSDSIKIIAHKRICDTRGKCLGSTIDQNFANSIKENIISTARTLKIEEAKKEKK
jgi:hypothetical protein